jgi:uncharacterized protein (DUF1330 family)
VPKGFFIVQVEVTDEKRYGQYLTEVNGLLQAAGGRIVVGRGSRWRPVEGDWNPPLFFVIEFPSYEAAEAFYFSEAYQKPLQHRLAASKSLALLAEEVPVAAS